MKIYFIIVLLIHSRNSNANIQDDCPVCKFDDYFNRLNGYGCYIKSVNETLCTCPDRKLTINQPCRICNRTGICGSRTVECSEKSSGFGPTNDRSYFVCICSSDYVSIGEKCPEETTIGPNATTVSIGGTAAIINMTITSTITVTVTTSSTTATKDNRTATQTTTNCKDRSRSSHIYIEPILIIVLNLVYFVNK